MAGQKEILLSRLRGGLDLSTGQQIRLTMLLAVPAILSQLSMCLMSYIDAAMVGRLGSVQAASVGLVSSTTWIFGSLCYANSSGFSVQIAHKCGSADFFGARRILLQGLCTLFSFGIALGLAGVLISGSIPVWLGGAPEIISDASDYFRIYALFLPVFQIAVFSEAALIASGNTKVPCIISLSMCVLDVVFNYIFIFRLGMGVKGAAIGTGLAEFCAGAAGLAYILLASPELSGKGGEVRPYPRWKICRQALGISWPLWIQNLVTRGAYIAATVLVAPLGTIAVAANSFAIIAEGFCYLPGYGMQDAATTLVGQSLGAGRKDLTRRFSFITISSGAAMMTFLAVLMWLFATPIMGLLSTDPAVIELGAKCLRIEAWAELLFGVSIVANGCFTGAGDTLFPSAVNLLSMWAIRIGLALALIPRFGLEGYWYAMAIELSFKGVVFAIRVRGKRWMNTRLTKEKYMTDSI